MTTEYFTREEYTTPVKRRYHEFDASLNGTTKRVRIQSLTALERSRYELSNLSEKGTWTQGGAAMMDSRLVAICVVDQDGQRIMTDEDAQALLEQDGAFVKQIFDECYEHVGLRERTERRLAKNSDAGERPATHDD